MEETLGKRIIAHRKRLGMTQDRLAEQLGVTAQAVSKWENDQSCPDISMLPKLAELFGISIDALLGVTAQAAEAEVVDSSTIKEEEPEGLHYQNGNWEFHWDGGKKSPVWFALWVLLMGGLMLFNVLNDRPLELWDLAWPSALLLFGLGGLYPRFSFFRFGCVLFGGTSLLENMEFTSLSLSSQLLIPIAVLLFGLSLLIDAFCSSKKRGFSFTHGGKTSDRSHCDVSEDGFDCDLSFGARSIRVDCPRLRHGDACVSFGELTVDLSGCEEVAAGCSIDADCSFGQMTIRVPSRYRVEADSDTAFGNFEVRGIPDPEPAGIIRLDASASFGEICVKYI